MKQRYFLVFFSTLVVFSSCKKHLEDQIYDKLVPSLYFNNDDEALSSVNSIYGALNGTGWDYYGAGNERIQMLHDATTDVFAPTSGSGYYPDLNNFNWKAADYAFNINWIDAYKGISYSNYIIEYLPQATKVSDNIRKRGVAEAKAGLGLFYKDLVELYGDVPLITSFDAGITAYPSRTAASQVLMYAKQKLYEAIPDLPLQKNYPDADNGRFSQGGAYALLTKIYLDEKNWDSVIYCADKIISSAQYQLDQTGYADLFIPLNQHNPEFIVVKQCYPDFNTGNTYPTYCLPPDFALPAGVNIQIWNAYRIRRPFFQTFDTADQRRALILDKYGNTSGTITTLSSPADVICMKYGLDSKANIVFATNDMPLIRLADILLAKAEALNQKSGPTQAAVDLVNQIRDRAFNHDLTKYKKLTDFASKQDLDDWILKERGWELYFEGHRRMDLIRHGKFLDVATARGATDPSAKRLLFPIPQSERDVNPNLTQNTGY